MVILAGWWMLRTEVEQGAMVSLASAEHHDAPSRDEGDHDDDRTLDAQLVQAAQRGDLSAMTELHDRYAPMVHGILLSRVPAREADDIAQDVFVQAISKLQRLRDPTRFAGWLAMITRNAATDHHRRKRVEAPLAEERHAGRCGGAERRLRAIEALDAIKSLPMAYREVLVLRLVEGMTGPEIARRTGLTAGSVRVNLHRGMKLLRQALQDRADQASEGSA